MTAEPLKSDIELVLAEMQKANALTADLVAAQLVTQAAQEEAAMAARKAADYAEQRLAVERGFFMDVGSLLIEVRSQNELMRSILNQTPLSEALLEFTSGAERAIRHINYRLEIVLHFMQSAVPYLSTMGRNEREELNGQLKKALSAPQMESLLAQQQEWQASLNALREQEAVYGGVPPVELVNRIERAKRRTEEIKIEMDGLKSE